MLRPSLHQLEVFCRVVELQSMARAAEALTVAPSSISMQIQELERRFRTPLLVRSSRGTVPTSAGTVLHSFATGLFEGLDGVERDIAALGSLEAGSLRLSTGHTVGASVVRPVLQTFAQKHPEVDISYHVMSNSERAKTEVLEGRAEFALIGRVDPEWPVDTEALIEEPLVVAMAAHHPLAAERELTAAALSTTPLILRGSYVLGADRVVAALDAAGVHSQVIELGSTEAIKARVADGEGITVLPHTVVAEAVAAGQLVLRTFSGFTPHRTVFLARLPKTPLSPAAEAFVALLRERYDTRGPMPHTTVA